MGPESEAGRGEGLEAPALAALVVGVAGSVGLTLYAGLRLGAPALLLFLFAGWVVFPFLVFFAGYLLARRGTNFLRRVYSRTVMATSAISLVAYGAGAFAFDRPKTPVFVLVAPLSLLLVALVVPALVIAGRKR